MVYAEGEEENNDDSDNDGSTTVNTGSISSSIKDIDVAFYKGEAGFSVPIASLPGRAGLGYDLTLTYSSDVFNQSNSTNNISQASWVGLGFNLDSGYIYRDYGDEESGGIDFMVDQSDDSFYLSLPYVGAGKLIEIAGSETELSDGSKKIIYKTQSDSFARVEKIISPNGKYIIKWVITSADGTKYYFDHIRETVVYSMKNLYDGSLTLRMPSTGCYGEGDCTETINYPVLSGADKLAYRWDLTKIEDINGNLISFKYQDERRTINIQNAKSVSVDYQCYNPEISESWYADGEQCLNNAYNYCNGRTGQEFINCFTNRVNSACPNYVNGDGCEQMNGVCLNFDWSCRNATILGPKYFDFGLGDAFDTAYGLFPCGSGLSSRGSCWIPTDNVDIIQGDPDSNHKCYNTELGGGSDDDHSGNCTAYGGKPMIEGGSFLYPSQVDDYFICAQRGEPSGFYIGSLIDPNDGGSSTSFKSLTSVVETESEVQGPPFREYREKNNIIFAVDTYPDGSIAVGVDHIKEPIKSILPPAVDDVTPFNSATGTYTLTSLPGDAHCCAGFGENKQGDYSVADENACTPAALGGIDKVREYFRLPSATVQCYKKYSGDIYDNQLCKGFDLGPGGCNRVNGVSDLMLYSCCVGKVIDVESPVTPETPRSTRTMGQCLSSVPNTATGGYTNTCKVNIAYSNSCPESYVATSYLNEITDSAGNRVKFTYSAVDQNGDGRRDDYSLPNPINVTAQLCPGKESQIFLESEHSTTNQQLALSEVTVTHTNPGVNQQEYQLNKVVFNYNYKTNEGNDPNYYKKLVLEGIQFYGQDSNNKLPDLTFSYNNKNMVNKITYPTGGSISFEYVPATFNYKMVEVSPGYYSRYSCQDPTSGGCDNIVAYKVASKTVDDGMGEVYTTAYSYGDGVYHVEGQNPFVGYDSVTVNLPGGYGSTTSFFVNDNYNLIDPLRQICDDYVTGYDFASGVNNGYYDLFHRMSDVAYKSVSSDLSGNQVSNSASYVCPVVTYETNDVDNYRTKAYQNRLMKQENTIDGVKTVVEYTEYNEENGMPEIKLSTNSDGSVLKEVTSYAFAMPVGESNVHTIMKERNMLNHVFNQVLIDDSNEERLSYIYTNYRFYDENGEPVDYCNDCNYPVHPYKVSTWVDDTNGNGNPDPTTDEFVSVLFTKYDSYGNLLETLDPSGERSITYYGDSAVCSNDGAQLYHALPTCQENALGQRTRIGYDNLNRISEVIDANDLYIHYTYDGLHRLKTAKVGSDGFDSEIYDYHYGLDSCDSLEEGDDNCMNWVSSQKIIDFTTGLYSESKSFSDGLAMHMRTKTTKDSNTALKVDTTYNAIAKVDKVSEPQSVDVSAMEKVLGTLDGKSSSEVVLMYGDKLTSESIGDNSLKYVYTKDPLARVSKVFPLNTYTGDDSSDCSVEGMYCTQTEYSGTTDGKYYLQTVSDANGKYVTSKIDKFGRVVEVSDATAGKLTNNYDLLGNVVRAIDQEGKVTENVYDVGGRLVSTTTPNSGETSYTYDESGNIKTISDSENRLTLFNYDELNRVVSMSVNGVVLKENSYDVNFDGSNCREQGTSKGLLCEVRYNKYGNSISYLYDIKGRTVQVIESIQGVDYVTSYDYDDAGNVKRITSPNGDYMDYEYNKLNQLANADINSGQQFIFNYNDEGTISSISYPNSLTQSFTYTSRNWVDEISVINTNNNYLFREKYDYDKVGNLNGMSQLVQQPDGLWDSRSVAFSYDDLYRLTSVQDGDYYDVGEFSLDSMSYSYDSVGNRLTKDVAGNTGDVTSDDSYTYYPGTDKLESTNDCTYQYDNVGNMISKTCGSEFTSYLYDENNMIYRINMANGDILEFEYDALGRRTLKKLTSNGIVSSTLYVYGLGNNPIMTIDGQRLLDNEEPLVPTVV